jgi:glycosyltransferase involved in cell wall biosynthesis
MYKTAGAKISLVVDARCLQDPAFAARGVGHHAAAVLAAGLARADIAGRFQFVALTEPKLPPLEPKYRALFEQISTTAYLPNAGPGRAVFFSPSPMTHSPMPIARLLLQPDTLCAAVVLDFIPQDLPGQYLDNPTARLAYTTALAWLARYDLFLPISAFTDRRLREILGIDTGQSRVTGVAVRGSLLPPNGSAPTPWSGRRQEIVVAGGDDPRKNIEVALAAHATSALLSTGVRMVVVGGYSEARQAKLRRQFNSLGGQDGLLDFAPYLDDIQLRELYARARLAIVPSRIEGFSVPIIEASANGCPILAADCAAHAELLVDPMDRFAPDDADQLRQLAEPIIFYAAAHAAAQARQDGLWRRFVPGAVAARVWEPLLQRLEIPKPTGLASSLPTPAVMRGARPRLAFLSPMPPDLSGCADYSAATLAALQLRADITLFTETINPVVPAGLAIAGRVDETAHLDARRFDAVVSVIGNSHFHLREFELLLRYGGACIAHDARMVNFYAVLLGENRARQVASAELGRPVEAAEIHSWLTDQRRLKALFLGEIAEVSRPMVVHSPVTAREVRARHGVDCALLPYVPYRVPVEQELTPSGRVAARARLGVADKEVIMATFGTVLPDRAPEELIWATAFLRAWGFPVRLVFVGTASAPLAQHLASIARLHANLPEEGILLADQPVPEPRYRDWLAAADVGVQLRTYQLGGLSAGLLDCMAAALPTVATAHLAEAILAPAFVRAVPDAISAVLLAEAVADIIDSGSHLRRPLDLRRALLAERNFNVYATGLLASLGMES